MSDPIWFAYAPVAVVAAVFWAKRSWADEAVAWPRAWLVASIAFAVHFFAPFYALGLLELALERPVIRASSAVIACLAAFGAGWLIWGRRPSQRQVSVISEPLATQPQSVERLGRLLLALTVAAFVATASMIAFGFPRGFEPLAYHLPIGVHIFQAGSLKVWDHAFMHTYPANASIWYGYWLALGSERLAALSNLLFLLPLSAGLWEIGRSLGVNRAAQTMTLAGFVTIPIVAFSALECGADVGGMAWLACALALALTKPIGSSSRVAVVGICLGLAFGFKSLHLVAAVLTAAWVLYSELHPVDNLPSTSAVSKRSVMLRVLETQTALVVGFLAMGGYWLARNWVELGNPFYPVQLPILGRIAGWAGAPDFSLAERVATQFEWVRSSAEWWIHPWVEWHFINQNFKHSSGLGPFVASVVLVAVLATLLTLRSRDRRSADRRTFLLLGGVVILAVWAILGDRQPRYLMGALVFWVPLAGWFLSSVPPRWAPLQFGVGVLSVLAMLGVLLTKQGVEFGDRFVLSKQTKRWQVYEYPHELDALPANSVIMNLVERVWNYPVYGDRLSLKVVNYVSAQKLAAASRFGPDETPLEFDFDGDTLKRAGVTHVFALDSTTISLVGCASLNVIGTFDRQPSNRNPVRPARMLYEVAYNGRSSGCKTASSY